MKAKKVFLVDVETAGSLASPQIYDIAWTVTDRKGRVYSEQNFLIREVITNAAQMMGAFYAKKIFSWYIPALDAGTIRLANAADVFAHMSQDAEGCETVSAYNLAFDMRAIRATRAALGFAGSIFSRPVDRLCIWQFACNVALCSKLYHDLARVRGWISEAGNVRTTAQHAYAFLCGQHDFIEAHTALDDVQIEREIMARLFARRKTIPYNQVSGMAWKAAQ